MFERLKKIPSPAEIVAASPLSLGLKRLKRERDREVSEVIRGESGKFLVLVGPCSAHAEKPVLEYAERLAKLNEELRDRLVLVPRIYSSKSRTMGVGYMGMLSQPDPALPEDILKGIISVRRLNVKVMEETGLTAADEMLYPANSPYFEDLFSYIAVGARSCEDQLHRLVASGMDVPVGFKNPTGGSVPAMLNSVYAAQCGHTFKLNDWQVKSSGNPLAHAVLRGYTDGRGDHPNYRLEQVLKVCGMYGNYNVCNPAVIIDANHANSGKDFLKQIEICRDVIKNRKKSPEFKKTVKGLMIESFIEEGSQTCDEVFGKSITDPCLGWEDTERLLREIADNL